uniref:transcription repressor OFP13-like n=1 Tax=Erigeron canadensis TaxID=72917 RepID=UPI001CB95504|nr:transcription repressor OFP13-like [Erigeron canadensis]
MGKNMNFIPSLLLLNKQKQLWLWPSSSSCSTNNPKTLSFRATNIDHHNKDNLFVNEPELVEVTTTHAGTSCFTNSSSESACSVSTESEGSAVENIVRGARSDRLFFEPDATSSILETQAASGRKCSRLEQSNNNNGYLPYKESVAMVIESENPYFDFKKSMEEMVEIHELKDWNSLEELLGWFLRMNAKVHHEFIVGAFVDLLAGIYDGGGGRGDGASLDDHRSTGSFTSVGSTFSSPISSPTSQGKIIMVTK